MSKYTDYRIKNIGQLRDALADAYAESLDTEPGWKVCVINTETGYKIASCPECDTLPDTVLQFGGTSYDEIRAWADVFGDSAEEDIKQAMFDEFCEDELDSLIEYIEKEKK